MRLPSDDDAALREACREVLGKHSTSSRIRLIAESETGHDPDFWGLATDLGWAALAVPESAGGLGGWVCDLSIVAEELGRAAQPSLLTQTIAVGHVLGRYGDGDPAALALLVAIASGAAIVSWAVGEPDDAGLVELADGPAGSVLRGRRAFVPDGQCATHLAVRAHATDGSALVVLPIGTGVQVAPMQTLDITRRYARVEFDGVALGADSVRLPGAAATDLFELGVVLQCAESTGVARRLLDMTVTYAKQRTQFGQPIGSFQAIKHRIADMLIEVEGCRVATRDAAEAVDAGSGVAEAVSVAKSWVGPAASFVASHAVQLHGGIGFSWEHDAHLLLRRAKTNELLLGTPSWHADRLCKLIGAGGSDD